MIPNRSVHTYVTKEQTGKRTCRHRGEAARAFGFEATRATDISRCPCSSALGATLILQTSCYASYTVLEAHECLQPRFTTILSLSKRIDDQEGRAEARRLCCLVSTSEYVGEEVSERALGWVWFTLGGRGG